MRQGFSLVELMVVMTVMLLLVGGVFIYINNFNASQKVETTRNELVSSLRLARSYAMTNQMPDAGSLQYIKVTVSADGVVEAKPNGVGTSYYSRDISPTGVEIIFAAGSLRFSVYDGKLVNEGGGSVASSATVTIIIGSSEGVGTTRLVDIKPSGLVDER